MAYTIKLSDGTILENLGLNGNNFVSQAEVTETTFTGKLKGVEITDDEGKTEKHDEMELAQVAHYADGYYFILADKVAAETEQLAKAIADLTAMMMA